MLFRWICKIRVSAKKLFPSNFIFFFFERKKLILFIKFHSFFETQNFSGHFREITHLLFELLKMKIGEVKKK